MWVDDVLANRFVIRRPAGSGGMGVLYHALDRLTGTPVAVKVLDSRHDGLIERFLDEARALSELAHPAIVQYIAHGRSSHGDPFIVMEWLDGEDLAERLTRTELPIADTVALIRRVAEGLTRAHALGIIHRDIKPSNLFLVSDDPRQVKILDFGVARFGGLLRAATHSGVILGTAGYMAPEQIAGSDDLDARADVFSLGCVLAECLTGRPVFAAQHMVAVLAKVLQEDPPRLREVRPDVPPQLEALVMRMLAKDRALRPDDAAAVLADLDTITNGQQMALESSLPPDALTRGEQGFISVVLAEISGSAQPQPGSDRLETIRGAADRMRGETAVLPNGAILITFARPGNGGEQAIRAAHCALELRALTPVARIALATGLAERTGRVSAGPVIDRAAALLAAAEPRGAVAVDPISAAFIETRFQLDARGSATWLLAERRDLDLPRTLLGKVTPFVGRSKEIAFLQATFDECESESIAHAALVTGGPGIGKSRVRQEFVTHIRDRARVLLARPESIAAGSSLSSVRHLVRHAADLSEGAASADQHGRLRGYLARYFGGPELTRIAEFLGELVGLPSPDEPSPQLCAARNDRRILRDWTQRSFEDWLEAECRFRPVVIVLEDLHYGDLPSVLYIDSALRKLSQRPLMVLALARPEVHTAFPKLWAGTHEIALGGLTRRAAEMLVRTILGERIDAVLVTRLIERAGGNVFYLEELIRRVAEGRGDELPETVLAMVEARLEQLEPDARRILRAASIFGEVFWEGGVRQLLGADATSELTAWLRVLCERELIEHGRQGKFPEQAEYAFRHGLLREAAYATLTASDRGAGHRLAAHWLESTGERDPLVISDHFDRGGEAKRALPWLVRAAQASIDGGSPAAAIAIAKRAAAAGAAGEVLGRLRMIEAYAHAWSADWSPIDALAREAMILLDRGSTPWFQAAAITVFAGVTSGDATGTLEVVQAVAGLADEPEPTGPFASALFLLIAGLWCFGQPALARDFLERLEAASERGRLDPTFSGWLTLAELYARRLPDEDLGGALTSAEHALKQFELAGDELGRAVASITLGQMQIEVARFEACQKCAADALSRFEQIPTVRTWARACLARAHAFAGLVGATTREAEPLLDSPNLLIANGARASIAEALLRGGQLDDAERHARQVLAAATLLPPLQIHALSVLARIELERQRPEQSLELVERAMILQQSAGTWPLEVSILKLSRAESLRRLGRAELAASAAREAAERVRKIAETLRPGSERQAYVEAVDEHRRTLALAHAPSAG